MYNLLVGIFCIIFILGMIYGIVVWCIKLIQKICLRLWYGDPQQYQHTKENRYYSRSEEAIYKLFNNK